VSKKPAHPPEKYFHLLLVAFLAALLGGSLNSVDGQEPLRGVPWQGDVTPWDPASYQGQPTSAPWWRGLSDFEPSEYGPLFVIGPIQGNLSASVGLYYTDNAGLTNTGAQDQLRLFEHVGLRLNWPISGENRLGLNLGLGLNQVLAGTRSGDNLSFTIAPDSNLGLTFFIGDFRIHLFDRMSLTQDPTSDSSASGVISLNRFYNNGGAAIDWNLNKVILTLQVDDTYVIQNPTTAGNQSKIEQEINGVNGNRNTVRAAFRAAAQLNPTLSAGPQVALTQTSASAGTDLQAVEAGLFLRGQLTRLTSFSLEGGVNFVNEQGNHFPFTLQHQAKIPSTDYYVRAKANQRVTRFVQLAGEVLHDLDYGDGINLIERTVGDLTLGYRLSKAVYVTIGGRYEDGNVLTGSNQGRYSLYQINAGITRRLGPRLSGSFNYRFIQRTSGNNKVVVLVDDQPVTLSGSSQSYTQNLFLLSLSYVF
jgi:hypothetical protein